MTALISHRANHLHGTISLPGDKSISHRALILGTLALGQTRIHGLLEGADVLATAKALQQLGGQITKEDDGSWVVGGIGLSGFHEPESPLDLGNSGTGARLLMGVIAGSGIKAVFTGDSSLSARPMARVTSPLEKMGAIVSAREGTYLPLMIEGQLQPMSITYHSPHASAQIKSAVLLAGLTARGQTTVIEPRPSRNHTEAMLRHFGVAVEEKTTADGGMEVSVFGDALLTAADVHVPADPSSAAFPAVAALITEGSEITMTGIGTNPLRFGLFETLMEMGGDITLSNHRTEGGETVADITVRSSRLRGIDVPAERAASMIDEYPVLSVAAAFAEGKTHMEGIGELRVKETDRIALMEEGLRLAGATVSSSPDSMTVVGSGKITGGITVDACHDHRIAMSFLVLGQRSEQPICVEGTETIATSFPDFRELMHRIGADIRSQDR
ncbi:MAG: 3-phosphoshikimate 1-carboxyvinyltransferase [Alphaproteobacteria bacterium]|nr:3-phosphoshikimate 1-carboxyvinyltransferase [Alphaproteobacteria bacterium]